MSEPKLQPLVKLIDRADSSVGHLFQRSAQIQALTAEVRNLLPEPVRPHLLVACLHEDALHLVVDASVWAAQLRLRAEDIRTSMNMKQGHRLQKVAVSVRAAPLP